MGSRLSMRIGAVITAVVLWLALIQPGFAITLAQRKQLARAQFETAEIMRGELNAKPAGQRTLRDYQQVADAYRRVYHSAPTSSKADSAVTAVAQLLAEAGGRFSDASVLLAAVSQYEFLRREYPGSKYRVDALFTMAQIYQQDLHDREQAKLHFEEFLRRYPRSALADDARAALKELAERPERSEKSQPSPLEKRVKSPEVEAGETVPAAATLLNTASPTRSGGLSLVTGIRYWSTPDYTRIAIDLESEVQYQTGRVPNPDRIFFDLHDTKLASALMGKSFDVQDGFLRKIRVAQYQKSMTRVVLEVNDISEYSAFLLPNPFRLIIDIHGRQQQRKTALAESKTAAPSRTAGTAAVTEPTREAVTRANAPVPRNPAQHVQSPPAERGPAPVQLATKVADGTTSPLKFDEPVARLTASVAHLPNPEAPETVPSSAQRSSSSPPSQSSASQTGSVAAPPLGTHPDSRSARAKPALDNPAAKTTVVPSQQGIGKKTVETKPVPQTAQASSEAELLQSTERKAEDAAAGPDGTAIARLDPPGLKSSKPTTAPTFEAVTPRLGATHVHRGSSAELSGHEARPTAEGDRSLTRVLGLKIGRIVVDAGHGGHDTGTVGPDGLQEKDLTLDVALRLGKLLQSKLGADVIYTRDNDTFIPLETRTAIANQSQADLFISIHANSSSDASARGVETYYLNFTSSADALEVAARENAVSANSIHELQDLVKKIALKEKIQESREFAADVQKSLWSGLAAKNPALRNRGVKKAPFIVLIGANMPSILAEISFLSNPADAHKLNLPDYRQKIAEYLYRGVARYVNGLSGINVAQR